MSKYGLHSYIIERGTVVLQMLSRAKASRRGCQLLYNGTEPQDCSLALGWGCDTYGIRGRRNCERSFKRICHFPQVAHAFPKVAAQNIRAFANSDAALHKVNAFLDGGVGDPTALYFFGEKGDSGLR